MHKPTLYVVEGRHDYAKLKEVDASFEAFITHGAHFNHRHLDQLRRLNAHYRLVLLLDPDGAGARIEKRIRTVLPWIEAIYVPKTQAQKIDGKIGIEHMDVNVLKTILTQGTRPIVPRETWTPETMIKHQLSAHSKARIHRRLVAERLLIPYANAQQFIKILNRYAISERHVQEIIHES
jgi:ribonuclease M5